MLKATSNVFDLKYLNPKAFKAGYQKGYRAGIRKLDNDIKKDLYDWHKHEQTGFEVACLRLDCSEAQQHVESCVAYGQPYPKK